MAGHWMKVMEQRYVEFSSFTPIYVFSLNDYMILMVFVPFLLYFYTVYWPQFHSVNITSCNIPHCMAAHLYCHLSSRWCDHCPWTTLGQFKMYDTRVHGCRCLLWHWLNMGYCPTTITSCLRRDMACRR